MFFKNIKIGMISVGVVVSVMLLASCVASTVQGHLRSNSKFEKVYTACFQAVADINYSVTSNDRLSGLIAATQPVIGSKGGKAVVMNIGVKQKAGEIKVEVAIVPPYLGAIGNLGNAFDRYVEALRKRGIDVEVVSKT